MFNHQEPEENLHLFEFEGGLSETEAIHYLEAMDQILKSGQAFSLIIRSDGNSPMPLDQRKAGNLWFKDNREAIARFCRGLVRIKPDLEEDYENGNFAKAMPFPVRVATDQGQALTQARSLLRGEADG